MKLACIGFGVVARGLAEIIHTKGAQLREAQGVELELVAICDLARGSIYDPDGLDLRAVLDVVAAGGRLDELDVPHTGWDALRSCAETNADVVVEVTPTDMRTGEPAGTHIKAALTAGKSVVTTNKGPVVRSLREIRTLAAEHKVQFRCEGTVMSGTPVLDFAERCLAGCRIDRIRGILNGTTNFILTRMEEGMGYDEALKTAQKLGYAEAKPDADVLGWDAQGKVVILADVVMGAGLGVDDVACTGITEITPEQIAAAAAEGQRWKLIADVHRKGETITASVAPVRVDLRDPLASIGGATNAITFSTDLLGEVTVVGAGAGRLETGFALLADILEIARA